MTSCKKHSQISAAAADQTTRMGAIRAMQQTAVSLKETVQTKIGDVYPDLDGSRARNQYRDGAILVSICH